MSETGPVRRLASLTTEEAAGVLREGTALLLPVGLLNLKLVYQASTK